MFQNNIFNFFRWKPNEFTLNFGTHKPFTVRRVLQHYLLQQRILFIQKIDNSHISSTVLAYFLYVASKH